MAASYSVYFCRALLNQNTCGRGPQLTILCCLSLCELSPASVNILGLKTLWGVFLGVSLYLLSVC